MWYYILILIGVMVSCAINKGIDTEEISIDIIVNVYDEEKAKAFDLDYLIGIPYQELKHFLKIRFQEMDIDTTFGPQLQSYFLYSNVYGKSEKVVVFEKDTNIQQRFLLWYQPLNFTEDKIIYYHNNAVYESDLKMNTLNRYPAGQEGGMFLAENSIDFDNDSIYYLADHFNKKKKIYKDSSIIVDFQFKTFNKKTKKESYLFSASDVVDDKMLNPELFEDSESPLYKHLDIYHWNWLQKNGDKMLINYAFSGFQQVDLNTKKVDWHWGYLHHTFNKKEGVGDLSNPYYTHHLNLIKSGPHEGRYSYFENGSEPIEGRNYKPARGRIIEIDTLDNSVRVVWEKVFDFASIALGSINVFDNYILINVGLSLPLQKIDEQFEKNGKKAAVDYYNSLYRPMLYLYDDVGSPIADYIYEPGFYSFIASPIKRK